MGTAAKPLLFPSTPEEAGDPYFYGWRMVPRWHENGGQTWERVPLTEWDVLHPEEGDFIVHNAAHDRDIHYVKAVFEDRLAGRVGVQVLCDHRVDWGEPALGVHAPDVTLFANLNQPWDVNRGTFPVREMGARPLVVVEVTSPSTRYVDLDAKVLQYHRAGVPLYVICDRREAEGKAAVVMIGYRATPEGNLRLPEDPRGVWVEAVGVWVRGEKDRVVCTDEHGTIIPDHRGQRDAEKARADAAEQKLKALEEELKRLRGDKS
jgi:hypothetical protein